MDIFGMIPLLVTILTVQVILQVFSIRHAMNNPKLGKRGRVLTILLIMLFNNIAVSTYLFLFSKNDENYDGRSAFRMGIYALINIAFQIFIIQIGIDYNSIEYFLSTIWLSVAIYVGIILAEVTYLKRQFLISYVLLFIIYFSALSLEILMSSTSVQLVTILSLVAILNIINHKHIPYFFLIVIPTYIGFTVAKLYIIYGGVNQDEFAAALFSIIIITTLSLVAFATLKTQKQQYETLKNLLIQVQEQSKTIEEMTAKEERNRLAADIHDHVGHTLTTAIIQLESIQNQTDMEEIYQKVNLSKNQVRKGLSQIRSLVQTVDINYQNPFELNVNDLIDQTSKHTDLSIHSDVSVEGTLVPIQQKVILSAIKEFFTNAIKHGTTNEVNLLITTHLNVLEVSMSNETVVSTEINLGFGLRQMKRSVESIGGVMSISANNEFGFSVYIKIPVGVEERI